VTGATTTAGSLTQGQVVKLVVIGGGLASPVTLQVNTAGGTAVTTSGAITDLENQFSGSAVLQAAGLSMTGSSTAGSQLTFTSASGQAFNIEMTGDTSNLLGLGSFSADAAGHADYTEITAGTAYSAATVTGSATTTGLAAGLEISLNGQQATALTAIDLTAGAHAVAASLTSSAPITGGFTNTAGQVDLTATTDQANITVINNGVANNQAFTFGANTAESQATAVSSGMTQSGFGGYTETLTGTSAGRSDQFTIALDGGAAHTVTLDNTYASGSVGAASFLTDLQTVIDASGIGAGKVVASWALVGGAHTGALTLTSAATNATGTASSLSIGAATNATSGAAASTLTSTTGFPISVTAAAHNNQFSVSVNGAAAMTLTLADNTAYTATTFLAAVQNAIANAGSGNTNSLGTNQTGTVSANWALDGSGLHTGALTLTSATTGAGSTVSIGQATYGTAAVQQSSLTDTAGNITGGAKTIVAGTSDQLTLAVDGGPSVTVVLAAAPYTTSASLLGEINTEIGSSALSGKVIASWATGGHLLLTSLSTNGAASTVNVSVSAHDASVILGLTAGTTAGTAQNNTGDVSAGLTKNVVNPGNPTAANGGLGVIGIAAGLTHGGNDAPQTVQSIAATIQAAFGVNAVVTVSNDNKISIASATKGANSSVLLNATANSVYGTLNLTSPVVPGLNSSIGDVVNNLNAQFSANGTAYQAAGLTAIATKADGTVDVGTPGNNVFVSILSNNGTQFRLNAVGAPAVATAAKLASSVTDASFSATTPLTVTLNTNDKINVAVGAGGVAQTLQVAAGIYTTATGAGSFLAAVQAAIAASVDPTNGIAGKVTAGWDAATRQLTFTSVATGSAASVTVSAAPSGNTGLANLGFGTGSTSSGQLSSTTENTGFGVAGRTFTAATPGSSGTAMSTLNAYGISNSGAFTFSALQYGSDKQALTFSATDANGTLETETITLQNNASVNRAGASIDDAVAYLNQQLQQTTANPALQKIVAVKQANAGGTAEAINFVSSLSNFTVGVAATANGDGLNSGLATYRTSAANGSGANMSIDTAAGAMAAITAIAAAIDKLGAAQATIGKGENQLTYAVNLAQSQITNFSAAESQIRDANVAQQAANLSKAQVLTQASIAAMAQANSAPQAVLTLLRG
jgi:flagellin